MGNGPRLVAAGQRPAGAVLEHRQLETSPGPRHGSPCTRAVVVDNDSSKFLEATLREKSKTNRAHYASRRRV
ncbi:hypothetical protein PLANPX_0348 [Lacipirellula parvula]|uniref:Uncharacterized protein n=1 Tax=Lacipirellula parvula TaxID=2650471 RepID=A0A5K7X8W8_9BACT|nr:hypothetical protein PLANPX_0348 [Lacipirellula parvula]